MNNIICKCIVIMLLSFLSVISAKAQQVAKKFITETGYLLYLPKGYTNDTFQKWPLLLFLHGSGESGNDLEKLKVTGLPKLIEQGKAFPFIIASPQAKHAEAGFQPELLKEFLLDLKKKYRVDEDRVYLTGISMGGFATWELAEKDPEDFAAIAPICSGGPVDKVWKLRHMPVWCFHGAKDDAVPLSDSKQMVDSLKNYESEVRFTIYPEANHNSWDTTYNNDSLYTWLLAQKKFKYSPVVLQKNLLEQYIGVYTDRGNDTLRIILENNKLMIDNGHDGTDKMEMIPSSGKSFFISENLSTEIIFSKGDNGKSEFWLFDQQNKNQYKKIKP